MTSLSRPLARLALLSAALLLAGSGFAAAPGKGPAPAPEAHAPLRESVRVVDRPWERIGLTVTVTDRQGRPVKGLGRGDFVVSENGAPVDLADFGPEEGRRDRPLSVAVLLDLSDSMREQVHHVKEASEALLRGLRPGDEIMVAKFNDQVTVLQPFTGDPGDPGRTLGRIGAARGGTALFQAVEKTLKDVRSRPGRKIILVVSDGLDNDLDRSEPVWQSLFMQDLLRLCLRTQTVVYGVRPGMPSSWLPFEGFVEATGGRLLYTGGDLERLFARLGEEFLSQYYLGYDIDPKAGEGSWRRLKIQVTRPDVVVSGLQGYFTPRGRLENLLHDAADDDAAVRADAVFDLGFADEARARAALHAALFDKDAKVRAAALEGLSRLREAGALPDVIAALADADLSVRRVAACAIEGFGPQAIEALCRAVRDGGSHRRPGRGFDSAVDLLGRLGDDRAIDALGGLLQAEAWETRLAAVRAIGATGLASGASPLRTALADPRPEVRRAAAEGLASVAGTAARPVLEDFLKSETDAGVKAAVRALLDPR
jgi:VWFA-related protein